MINRLSKLLVSIGAVGITVMTVVIGWQVFGRYVLNASPAWSEQLALVLMVWIVMFTAAAGSKLLLMPSRLVSERFFVCQHSRSSVAVGSHSLFGAGNSSQRFGITSYQRLASRAGLRTCHCRRAVC
jgi:hypothetical protein